MVIQNKRPAMTREPETPTALPARSRDLPVCGGNLMPQRLGGVAREFRSTTTAFGRLEPLHVVALVDGNQRSFVFLVAGHRVNGRPWVAIARLEDLPKLAVQLYLTLAATP